MGFSFSLAVESRACTLIWFLLSSGLRRNLRRISFSDVIAAPDEHQLVARSEHQLETLGQALDRKTPTDKNKGAEGQVGAITYNRLGVGGRKFSRAHASIDVLPEMRQCRGKMTKANPATSGTDVDISFSFLPDKHSRSSPPPVVTLDPKLHVFGFGSDGLVSHAQIRRDMEVRYVRSAGQSDAPRIPSQVSALQSDTFLNHWPRKT